MSRQTRKTKFELALMATHCFIRGEMLCREAHKFGTIRIWTSLGEILRGSFHMTQSKFYESVQLVVREWISRAGEGILIIPRMGEEVFN
jgi:hypothetical protein